MSFELTQENAVDYLASRGLVDPAQVVAVELLGWGVSNTLVKVCTPGDCLVIKQSLARLRVADEWLADRDRIQREQACIEALSPLLPEGVLPQVRYADPDQYLFVMTCAPEHGINWKEQLLGGKVHQPLARRVGELLGLIHRSTAESPALRERFIDQRSFIQLRVDPYHQTIAQVHPELAPVIRGQAQRLLEVRQVLVHGDYSPKNVIVVDSEVFLLDFEVVHYGNPAFDLAFMLSHLTLKAIHLPQLSNEFCQAVHSFWQGYVNEVRQSPVLGSLQELEYSSIGQLGCLLLARVDGKSPVEYITHPTDKELVRSLAQTLLLEAPTTLSAVTDLVSDRISSRKSLLED